MKILYTLAASAVILMSSFASITTAEANSTKNRIQTSGKASWYKCCSVTANGEKYNPHGITAAHRTLPFGTKVEVTNVKNGKSVVVRINDRGPYVGNRVIDLSLGAAKQIGMIDTGVANVKMKVIGK